MDEVEFSFLANLGRVTPAAFWSDSAAAVRREARAVRREGSGEISSTGKSLARESWFVLVFVSRLSRELTCRLRGLCKEAGLPYLRNCANTQLLP